MINKKLGRGGQFFTETRNKWGKVKKITEKLRFEEETSVEQV